MNKDLLKDPCSDALNPSLSKEGNALFIVGGIRWIKRCSWWGWCVASVCVCVFFCLWASLSDYVWFRWHPECICVYIKSSLCVCVCVHRVNGRPVSCAAFSVSTCELNRRGNQREVLFFIFFIGHFMFSLMNVFIGYVIRSSSGWLVKLFNFINLRWNLLCRPKLV